MTPDVPIDESKLNPGQRGMIRLMREAHIPITRENYINVAWHHAAGGEPERAGPRPAPDRGGRRRLEQGDRRAVQLASLATEIFVCRATRSSGSPRTA
jgi:hypothetical protein